MRRYLPDEPDDEMPDESEFDSFDIGLPHAGVWSRDDKRAVPELVCKQHGLSRAEH
jgi:hypothetical protein